MSFSAIAVIGLSYSNSFPECSRPGRTLINQAALPVWVQCKWWLDTKPILDFAEKGVYFWAKPNTYNLKIRGIFLQKICHKNHLNSDEHEILA